MTDILEWVQCFGIYMAAVALKQPERIQDLLGYQTIIVEACMEYTNNNWLGYDRRFRKEAATSPKKVWARIDPSLYLFGVKPSQHKCAGSGVYVSIASA